MNADRRGVLLAELLAAFGSGALTAHHVPAHDQSVRDVVIISDVDRVLTVGPDTVVLLREELTLGGWVVSVALRYAWERRAVALIVPAQAFSETVVELARRFGVALFTTDQGIDHTALALARELGALEAGVLTRLDALHARVNRAATLGEVLDELSRELDGALVQLHVAGIPVAESGAAGDATGVTRVPLAPVQSPAQTQAQSQAQGGDQQLVAIVDPAHQQLAHHALTRARATVRALLLAHELDGAARAAPLLSFAALTATRAQGIVDGEVAEAPVSQAGADGRTSIEPPWPPGTPLLAVVLRVARGDAGPQADRIAPVLGERWRRQFRQMPLARTRTGWFAFIPLTPEDSTVLPELRELTRSAFGPLGVAVGVALDREPVTTPTRLLARAWFAARLAEPDGRVVDFRRLGTPLLQRLLPVEDARELAESTFPRLLADPHAAEVRAAVVAYLGHAGSVTAAAESLGVHRNTLQLRLRRAVELGVRLDEPDQQLSTHLLLAVLDQHATTTTATTPTPVTPPATTDPPPQRP
ncbi:helix-turn-helix domain-containing protein [Agromyces aerolatus]|uniref:helix-turn-helix domain-containing protein n=1 Tax=Agromyces sp. LY-1074 TaxID=3074080 RepID=UPI00285EAE5F|nr:MULTISPECIES: helix-turn-helix domain-containing protein [unclassified Agromyces]MDR5701129.1 helix-turn-helix domain-containing protein [Agromyces sp. LY-1074]MDR5707769.1 helix-turn-helix domain-containing protein [Agromyces sp. LY-1358]